MPRVSAAVERSPAELRVRAAGWTERGWLVLAIPGSVALVLGLVRLSGPSVWVDEAFTARAVRLPFPDYVASQYHALYYVLLNPWTALAGTSEWALRFPSVLAAVAACVLLAAVGRRLFDERVGLVAGLLLATSPFFVKWSQQGRSYTFAVACSLLALLLLLRALGVGTRLAWLAYGLAFSASIVFQPVSALVLVPSHSVLLYQRRQQLGRHSLVAAIVIVAVCVPWMFIVSRYASDFWLERESVLGATRTILEVSGAGGVGVALGIAGILVLVRSRRRALAVWLFAWAFAPFMLAWTASFLKPVYYDRYLICAVPSFALLGGVAIVQMASRFRAALAVATVAATVVALSLWYGYDHGTNWRGEHWQQAVAAVEARLQPGERLVVVPWWAWPAADYYGAPIADTSTEDSVWVLSWSEDGHQLSEEVRRPLGFGGHRLVEQMDFGWRVSAQHWVRGG